MAQLGRICHEICRSTTLSVTSIVEKKTSSGDNCGEDECYGSVNALNQGLALSRSQGILLSVPSAVTYSLAELHLISIERIGSLQARAIHTSSWLTSVVRRIYQRIHGSTPPFARLTAMMLPDKSTVHSQAQCSGLKEQAVTLYIKSFHISRSLNLLQLQRSSRAWHP